MNESEARQMIEAFAARYDYDVSYMTKMLEVSPAAFMKFVAIMDLAAHNEVAPTDATFAAKILGAIAEDCGPCVQLVIDMAREAGMAPETIEAVLTRNRAAMSADALLGFLFADAVVRRGPEEDDARDAVRAEWGEAAVIDLTLGLQIGRVFPMVKAGMGYANSCGRVHIDDRPVDVVHAEREAA